MENDQKNLSKKAIANIEKMREGFMNKPFFRSIQKFAKEHNERMEKIRKSFAPTSEQIINLQKQMKENEIGKDFRIDYRSSTAYQILNELRELNKNKSESMQGGQSDIIITYNTHDSSLDRSINGRTFSYDLTEDGKRKKLLDILTERKIYVKTEELKKELKCPTTQAVAKIAQTFNDYAKVSLHLKNLKLIEGKKGSGYRINSKITIEKE